ncbi:MAG TPA: NADH-quinone oxidoreductase subunit M, partial [Prolixibacteraceae bacterium]|nr:NADH-quinone oxidoreductase subunit M [Prolixibacteraceae bacterium]
MKLLILLFLPLFAGLLLQITRKYRFSGYLAPASALISLVVTLMVISGVPSGNVSVDWMQVPGVRFNLQLDEISKIMLLLTGLLYPFILFSGWGREQTNQSSLQALLLFSQSALTGVFLAGNAFLFYVCWELALLPVFFILLLWGGPGRRSITLKFFIYTLAGSLFLLFGIIYLYLQTPGLHSADFAAMAQLQLPEKTQQWLFWILFIGLAVKMPLFPFHTWQPPAYTTAPLQGTMVLAGIMSKMGIYGVFRLLFPILPQGVLFWQNTVIILGLTGVVYASVIAFRQNNLKTLIAFSSLAHISLMVAALFAANTYAVQGVLFQVVAHGITIVALFYLVMLTEEKAGTSELSGMGGLKISAPRLALLFMLVMLGG